MSDEKRYETLLSKGARRLLCAGYFAEHYFVEPPDAEALLHLLESLGVPLERMEALVEEDAGGDECPADVAASPAVGSGG